MNFEAKIHSDSMICDWLKHIQEIHNKNEAIIKNGSKFLVPFVAIPMPVVKIVFMIVKKFHLSFKTKYLALCVYDKFMCNHFWELFMEHGNNPEFEEYKHASDRMSKLARLRLMSCIQLASKMDCHSRGLGISQVIYGLQLMESETNLKNEYTPNIILNSEFKILKTINFKIPIVTSVDSIEVLLAALNLYEIPKLYETAMMILDLTYLQHLQLYCQLQFMVTGTIAKTKAEKLNVMTMESDMLLLSAGIILCTLFILNSKASILESTKKRLSKLVKVEESNIFSMAHVILSIIDLPN
ncbi:hypothetical protein PV327_011033 [Microctonus hyperodae]|uniref:Cyclin N-terminal domain-containing protein n=1 Tax=Microctonus hyperodae TaxID=165561 RepID=A0AA39FR39_MICHY|nr:hypothetical protein PV327_011033 [Microctonus hyperodae]